MDEADRVAYGEEDLLGLKVAHDTDAFEEGETILTLKDSRILEGGEDELQNVNLADEERHEAARERKRKAGQGYTGYDDDEFQEGRIGKKAAVLSKYDGEFAGGEVATEGFRLGAPVKREKTPEMDVDMGHEAQVKVKLDLDFARDWDVSDYAKEGDPGFKKPKKRRAKKSTRRAEVEEDDGMDVEPTFTKRVVGDTPDNLVDDDDLQAALARSRRQLTKKKPKAKPEDLAARSESASLGVELTTVKQEREAEPAPQEDADGDDDGRITFDETSEFVRNVTAESRAAPVKKERSRSASATPARTLAPSAANGDAVVVKVERVDEDVEMSDDEDEDEMLAEMAAREGLSLAEYRIKIDSQMAELGDMAAAQEEPEAVVGNGLAGVLGLLRNQGALEKQTEDQAERERRQKQQDLWLADHRRRAAQRELDRIAARGGNKDQAQREYDNRQREAAEAREALEAFKHYRPDVTIKYHDELGREMTVKEAWKSLSHKFHGKTSGRMKTEKRLRKIAEEQAAQRMAAGDTPLGMSDAFARRQAKTGEAHMVLSVGNKGSAAGVSKKR
jgi:U4/U6.U5 tri-snRNP-associated protein 1